VNMTSPVAPSAIPDNTSMLANTTIDIHVKANDIPSSGATTLGIPAILGTVSNGTATVNPDGSIKFTPSPGFVGTTSFNYKICDLVTNLCDSTTVTVDVMANPNAANQAPVAINDLSATVAGVTVTGNASSNDSDPNGGQTLSYSALSFLNPSHGTIALLSNGQYQFVPAAGFIGRDSIQYRVCDNGSPVLCKTAYIVLVVNPAIVPPANPLPPVVTADVATTTVGTPVVISVKSNDYSPSGSALTNPVILGTPTGGVVVVNPDGTVTFTPNNGFVGVGTFVYQVCDQNTPVQCATATVSVTVSAPPAATNNRPIAINDAVAGPLNLSVSGNAKSNDSDPDAGQLLSYTKISSPNNGIANMTSSGVFVYTPIANFVGRDSFMYKVCDNGTPSLCDTAWIFVTILPANPTNVNLAPVAMNDTTTTVLNTPIVISVKSNDYDPNAGQVLSNPVVLGSPVGGSVVVNADGTVTFTPNTGFTGVASFVYQVCDNGLPSLCSAATVIVNVDPTRAQLNVAPVAVNDATTTPINTPVSGNAALNDADLNIGQILTYSLSTVGALHGVPSITAAGIYTYTPATGFVGLDSFQYKVCDNGVPSLCATAFVVINVTAAGVNVNLPPVATPDVTTTNVNVPVVINVKANDYDPNMGQVLGLPTITSQSTRGVATVNPDGTVTFTPATGFVGVTSFVYQVCDNGSPSACSTALVTVNVVAAPPIGTTNQPPVAIDDASTTTVNNAIVASSAGNDYDPNSGQTLSFVSTSIPAHGSVVMLPNGSYTYTPATGYVGPDQFKYKVCDNGVPSLCDSATVFITILDNPCITLTFKAMLEGPFNTTTGRMNTILNQRGLLPGQTPVGQFAVTTPVGQPYNVAPWNYAGIPSDTIRTYAADIVDWVLVSLRSDSTTATSTVWKAAGLLHSDGTITFTQPCFRFPLGSYFALVEHRNHLGVMSPVKLPVVNGILTFDFSTADSYIRTNPPSFGEKLKGGKYLMYAGDGKKTTATTNFDINFSDSQQWKTESGVFDQYRYSDFNLDADVNFADQVLWKANNGKYSGVPH
jgi:hypothetical protein